MPGELKDSKIISASAGSEVSEFAIYIARTVLGASKLGYIGGFYGKKLARPLSIYGRQGIKTGSRLKNMLKKLAVRQNHELIDLFHKVGLFIVEWCVTHAIGTLVIGYNQGWKQGVKRWKKNKQNFIQILFSKLIQQTQYKVEEQGIRMIL